MSYKVTFEFVPAVGSGAMFYAGATPTCKPDGIPDQYWFKASSTWDAINQYQQLKAWAQSGEQLIRNVKLYRPNNPQWIEVKTENG